MPHNYPEQKELTDEQKQRKADSLKESQRLMTHSDISGSSRDMDKRRLELLEAGTDLI